MATKSILTPALAALALTAMLATTACTSSGSPQADAPKDAATVPNSIEQPHDANIDNRGRGGG